jgi:hypothetical protein
MIPTQKRRDSRLPKVLAFALLTPLIRVIAIPLRLPLFLVATATAFAIFCAQPLDEISQSAQFAKACGADKECISTRKDMYSPSRH